MLLNSINIISLVDLAKFGCQFLCAQKRLAISKKACILPWMYLGYITFVHKRVLDYHIYKWKEQNNYVGEKWKHFRLKIAVRHEIYKYQNLVFSEYLHISAYFKVSVTNQITIPTSGSKSSHLFAFWSMDTCSYWRCSSNESSSCGLVVSAGLIFVTISRRFTCFLFPSDVKKRSSQV